MTHEDGFNTEDLDDEMFARRERKRDYSVSDFFKRAIKDTVGTVQEKSSPKEAIQFLISQGDRGRKELVRMVAKEVGDFLRHTDVSTEIVKSLTSLEVDLNATLRFRPSPDGKLRVEIEESIPRNPDPSRREPKSGRESRSSRAAKKGPSSRVDAPPQVDEGDESAPLDPA